MSKAPTRDELRMAEVMAEQQLVSVVREAVEQSGLDRQEVARRMGVHKSSVSRLLNTPRNMTIRIAARVLRAAGRRLTFTAAPCIHVGKTAAETYAEFGTNIIPLNPRATSGNVSFSAFERTKIAL